MGSDKPHNQREHHKPSSHAPQGAVDTGGGVVGWQEAPAVSLAASQKAWVTKEVGMGGELLPQVVLASIHSDTSMSEAQGIRKVFPPLAAPSIGDFNAVAAGE